MSFKEELRTKTEEIEKLLTAYLPEETGFQKTVLEAVNYSVLAGGKRLRPMLMKETYQMFGGRGKVVEPFMAAMEMIHTYSLVHDDLPAMDNDEYRRCKKTTHAVYGEAMGILAGDALLNLAFETAAGAFDIEISARTAKALQILSKKAGIYGMIGGQVLDMGTEHRKISLDELRLLQKLKTGCLLRAACELGCAAAGATDEDTLARARAYGEKLGLAFQIEDDILDIEGDAATLGKSIGKDAASEKSTFPSLLGLEECRELAAKLTEEAVDAVKPLDGHAFLVELARSLTGRTK